MNILKRTLKELTNILMSIYQVLFIDSKYRYEIYGEENLFQTSTTKPEKE